MWRILAVPSAPPFRRECPGARKRPAQTRRRTASRRGLLHCLSFARLPTHQRRVSEASRMGRRREQDDQRLWRADQTRRRQGHYRLFGGELWQRRLISPADAARPSHVTRPPASFSDPSGLRRRFCGSGCWVTATKGFQRGSSRRKNIIAGRRVFDRLIEIRKTAIETDEANLRDSMPKRLAFLCVVLLVLSTNTFAQNINDL